MYALGTHEADAKMGEYHLLTEKKTGDLVTVWV